MPFINSPCCRHSDSCAKQAGVHWEPPFNNASKAGPFHVRGNGARLLISPCALLAFKARNHSCPTEQMRRVAPWNKFITLLCGQGLGEGGQRRCRGVGSPHGWRSLLRGAHSKSGLHRIGFIVWAVKPMSAYSRLARSQARGSVDMRTMVMMPIKMLYFYRIEGDEAIKCICIYAPPWCQ